MSLYGSNPYFGGAPSSSGNVPFADPYRDMATASMPTTINSALLWGEYLWYAQGTYAMAMKRIASYFVTEVELAGQISHDEKDKIFDYLTDTIGVLPFVYLALLDRLCYGNSFVSVLVPFQRFLLCPHSRDMVTLKEVYENSVYDFKFDSEFNFVATCPKTGWRGNWEVIDKPRDESQNLILKRWNPHEIEVLFDPYTDECSYLWRIPENYKRMVREGNLFHLERVNKQVLTAIKHNQLFRFNKDAIMHLREPTLAGVRSMGWGLPPSLTHHRQLWYLQVLRRQHEAIGMDYIIPFRLITPAPRAGAGVMGGVATQDPMAVYNGQEFHSQVRSLISRRRRDPAGWHVLPFPVNYQMLGADANNLVPLDMMTAAVDSLLNETGTPVEFYKGTLGMQAAPIALRLFESTHRLLVNDANRLLQWITNTVCRILMWETVTANLRRVTIADDVQKQMAVLQLMAGRQLSGTSGLRAIGYDYRTERQYLMEEAKEDQELQARQQEEMEQAGVAAEVAKGINPMAPPQQGDPSQGGAPAQGGAAPAQGGAQGGQSGAQMAAAGGTPVSTYIQSMSPDAPITPAELNSAADMLADELLGLPDMQKNQQLQELKKFNPTLHSLVRTKLDEKRQQMRMIGGQQVQQQQYGTG